MNGMRAGRRREGVERGSRDVVQINKIKKGLPLK
jgi:hypothetical protein